MLVESGNRVLTVTDGLERWLTWWPVATVIVVIFLGVVGVFLFPILFPVLFLKFVWDLARAGIGVLGQAGAQVTWILGLIQGSAFALAPPVLGALGGLIVGLLIGGGWGHTAQLARASRWVTRLLRPRIDAALAAALDDPLVTRRFVQTLNALPAPQTGIDFMRSATDPLTTVRALQHPDALVALAYDMGRDRVTVLEARLVWRIYRAQIRMAWATACGDVVRAGRVYNESVIWMRALHEVITVRRDAPAHARRLSRASHACYLKTTAPAM